MRKTSRQRGTSPLPAWVPEDAELYLAHTEQGVSMRHLAQLSGCHASTVMRQIRKIELRRDDQLVDQALRRLGGLLPTSGSVSGNHRKDKEMVHPDPATQQMPQEQELLQKAQRVLQALRQPGATLAVAADMEKAVVVDNTGARQQVLDRTIAEAMALKQWISCDQPGRVSRYHITEDGLLHLHRLTEDAAPGFAEAAHPFDFAGAEWPAMPGTMQPRRRRYAGSDTPLALLARRRDKDGRPFLAEELVGAGERLREDYELARMSAQLPADWNPLQAAAVGPLAHVPASMSGSERFSPEAAQARVVAALRDLGPGLGDVALRCCCYLEGLEQAEKRMGWSARSAKIVLRIALQRLKCHYGARGSQGGLIG